MQLLRLNNNGFKGSTKYMLALWSLFFLAFLVSSCNKNGKSEGESLFLYEVEQMHQCQQKADNIGFYIHKYRAENIEDKPSLRYYLVLADYLMQVGNRAEARRIMDSLAVVPVTIPNKDTSLWLDYLCHQGEVNYRRYNIKENRGKILNGFDYLIQCYILSSRKGYDKYKAISMKLLSQYLLNDSIYTIVKHGDPAGIRYINEETVDESLLAGNLAERALCEFLEENDSYQTADAWRVLAVCFFSIGNAERSVECLHNALSKPAVDSLPALKANINQLMSMSYSALDDKNASDMYRNAYLDIQDSIRQDRKLEVRAMELSDSIHDIWYSVLVAMCMFVALCLLTIFLNHLRKKREKKSRAYNEEIENLEEQFGIIKYKYSEALRAAIEQSARISFVSSMLPLIERARIAAEKGQFEYVGETAECISKQNEMLTTWIKLRQGSVLPQIEKFSIQDLFSIVRQNTANLANQGVEFEITEADANVKADRVLTLFILNTVIDNARKSQSKRIVVNMITNTDKQYAEITVTDDGKGMSPEVVEHLFDKKPICDGDVNDYNKSHGFGLQNCRGIIDRYKKVSSVFSVCAIWAKSVLGKGTTIGFRLPLSMLLTLLFMVGTLQDAKADVKRYADSLYYFNVERQHVEAMQYADSCIAALNKGEKADSATLLSIYNETAVAALALHDWSKYSLYNFRYMSLYQDCTIDRSLPYYCKRLESYKLIADIAMIISVVLLFALIPIFWFVYLRHVYSERKDLLLRRSQTKDQISIFRNKYSAIHVYNNITDNHLSSLKHETMYYPSRIRQMVKDNENMEVQELTSVVGYYRELYSLLLKQMTGDAKEKLLFPVRNKSLSEWFHSAEGDVVVNEELLTYLLVLLKRHNSNKNPIYSVSMYNEKYYKIEASMTSFDKSMDDLGDLFSVYTCDTDFLVMRQILRVTGSVSGCYGCGISVEPGIEPPTLSFTLPCAHKKTL